MSAMPRQRLSFALQQNFAMCQKRACAEILHLSSASPDPLILWASIFDKDFKFCTKPADIHRLAFLTLFR